MVDRHLDSVARPRPHLQEWINDGLMTIFFFVVGLEIKRELVVGELRDPRRAALPAIAAAGGMLVPALIYAAFNAGGAGSSGWGIPVATDIAVAVGVVALLGSAVDPALKLFLLALAIVDDIGAIVIIAVFYAGGIDGRAAVVAVALVGAVVACRAIGVQAIAVYVVLARRPVGRRLRDRASTPRSPGSPRAARRRERDVDVDGAPDCRGSVSS